MKDVIQVSTATYEPVGENTVETIGIVFGLNRYDFLSFYRHWPNNFNSIW